MTIGHSSDPGCFWIEYPYPTGYRVSLVSVSESGSQNSLKPTILLKENVQKKIGKFCCASFLTKRKYGHFWMGRDVCMLLSRLGLGCRKKKMARSFIMVSLKELLSSYQSCSFLDTINENLFSHSRFFKYFFNQVPLFSKHLCKCFLIWTFVFKISNDETMQY